MQPHWGSKLTGNGLPRDPRLNAQGILLVAIILAIGVSPRIQIGALAGKAVELRYQDVVLVIALVVLTGSRRGFRRVRVWGHWFGLFLLAASVGFAIHLFTSEVSIVRQAAFFVRQMEPFFVAAAVCSLYVNAFSASRRSVLRVLHVAVFLNGSWVVYQILSGVPRTLLGSSTNSALESYGPKLIGEATPFSAGSFFAFAAALVVAEQGTMKQRRGLLPLLMALALVGGVVTQSRVSLAAIAVLSVIFVTAAWSKRRSLAVRVAAVALLAGTLGPSFVREAGFSENERLTSAAIARSVDERVTAIWFPVLGVVLDNSAIGVGPGAVGTDRVPYTEAHNVLLRAALDFGLFAAAAFLGLALCIFIRAWRRTKVANEAPYLAMYARLTCLYLVVTAFSGLFQDSFSSVMSSHLLMAAIGLFAAELIIWRYSLDGSRIAITRDQRTVRASDSGPPGVSWSRLT